MKYSQERIDSAKDRLSKFVSKGDTIYAIIRSVAKSGMSRNIDFYVIKDNQPIYLSASIAITLGWPMKGDYVHVSGCGMDMAFHTVYSLSSRLFGDGYCLNSVII